jgi:hypothetical protein
LIDREIEALLAFIAKVEEAKATIEIEDEREIPDEFVGKWSLAQIIIFFC